MEIMIAFARSDVKPYFDKNRNKVSAFQAGGQSRFLVDAALIPWTAGIDDAHDREHDRNLDQHAHDRGQRGTGMEAEQADGGGHRQLEEVAGAAEGRRAPDAMLLTRDPVEEIGEASIEIDLDQDRDR